MLTNEIAAQKTTKPAIAPYADGWPDMLSLPSFPINAPNPERIPYASPYPINANRNSRRNGGNHRAHPAKKLSPGSRSTASNPPDSQVVSSTNTAPISAAT